MAIVWQNGFNATSGFVTVENTANWGDPITSLTGFAAYTSATTAEGAGAAQVGTTSSASLLETELDIPGYFAFRCYVYLPTNAHVTLYLDNQHVLNATARTSYNSYLLSETINDYVPQFTNSWARVEMVLSSEGTFARLWCTDPHSTGAPDVETSIQVTIPGLTRFAVGQNVTEPGYMGVYVDAVAISDVPEWIGPWSPDVDGETTFHVGYGLTSEGEIATAGQAEFSVGYGLANDGDWNIYNQSRYPVGYALTSQGNASITGEASYPVQYELLDEATISTGGDTEFGVGYGLTSTGRGETTLPGVPLAGMSYRLIAYEPDGERKGQLPYPLAAELGVPHNDMPSLRLEYLRGAPGAHLLDEPCEVAIELSPMGQDNYVEYPGCRFLNLREQDDKVDRTGRVQYTMPNYGWMLRKVRNIRHEEFNEDGERVFTNATVGEILHTFLIEAQERDNIPGMVWDFTATHDSDGRPWGQVYNLTFAAGQDLWSILDSLTTQGALDWRYHRRTLQAYVTDTLLNRDYTNSVILRLHRDITEAPNDSSAEELASRIFVQGEGAHATINATSAMRPWGAWEDYISQSGVNDTGTLLALAQWRLEKTRALRRQMTRGLAFSGTHFLPFVHYLPGDRITAPGVFSEVDPLRVRQITLSLTSAGEVTGNVVLNDRFLEKEIRRDKQMNALTGGASGSPGGGGGRPREDTRTPKTPTDLLLTTVTYLNEMGEARGQITATWTPVEEATNNTEMDISEYQVWLRRAAAGEVYRYYTSVSDPDNVAYMSPFDVDEVYEVRVRAIAHNNRPSSWSLPASIRVEPDSQAPPNPSIPVLSSSFGTVSVEWDGLDFEGLPMPADFDHVRVWISADGNEFAHINTMYRAGSVVVPNLPYEEPRWFRLTAVDRSGNESEPSAASSITTEPLVPTDFFGPGSIGHELLAEGAVRDDILADDAVRNRHIAAGQVTGEKVRAYSIFADRLAIGSSRNLLADPHFRSEELNQARIDASSGEWSIDGGALVFPGDQASTGVYNFLFLQTPDAAPTSVHSTLSVDPGMGRLVGRLVVSVNGTLASGQLAVQGAALFLDDAGTQLGTSTVIPPQFLTGNTSELEMVSDSGAEIPQDATRALFYVAVQLASIPGAGTTVTFSQPFAAMSDGTVLIENGAISANKIAANAITADKIEAGAVEAAHIRADAIETEQLSADAITSKHTITGATIQTSASANRGLKITSTGLRGYDNVGNETFRYESVTGSVTVTGRYQSGLDGENRIVVSDTATWSSNPGLTMFSGDAGARDSSLFMAVPGDGSGYGDYSVVLTGSEVSRNSTGRTDLVLRHGNGGGAYLRYQFGTYGTVGIEFSNWEMVINGRMRNYSIAHSYQFYGATPSFTRDASARNITYGSAAPNGGRLVMLTPVVNFANDAVMTVATVAANQTLSGFRAMGSKEHSTTGTYRLNFLVTWTETSET